MRRLMPHHLCAVLILLQSVLTGAQAHDHPDGGPGSRHRDSPHAHAHELLDLLCPDLAGESDDDDGDDHDADAIDLTTLTVAGTPQAPDAVGLDLPPAPVVLLAGAIAGPHPFPLGLPPPTAGPPRPLYVTHCSLRN